MTTRTCPLCKGREKLTGIGCRGPKGCHTVTIDCPDCNGKGTVEAERCECGCCHATDWGACDDFEKGMGEHCVYCDHAKPCHERDKGNRFYNGPLRRGERPQP